MDESGKSSGADMQGLLNLMPFAGVIGIVLESAEPGEVRGRLPWSPERCTAGGVMHGGALMALADTLGGICAFLNLPAGAQTTTITSSTAFMRAVRDGEVIAVCRPLHAGRTVIVVQTDLHDAADRRVAQVTQAQAVLAART
jgi:1,4-dihydroxy-2-naphthoyl-CoA hydrolase